MGDRVQVPSLNKDGEVDQSADWDYIYPEGSSEREAAEAYHEDQVRTQVESEEDVEFRTAEPPADGGDPEAVADLVPDEAEDRPAAGAPDKPVDESVHEVAPQAPSEDDEV